ncbi:PKD domain-containing protein [Aquimarina sp. W85]|uniref:PKD domain-containing protein n=1 Tax=Aquimarina rhodophyticola TaxID=3342246 RepID=UPI0036729112
MKYRIRHIILLVLLSFSCAKEEAIPVLVDFDVDVFGEDYSIPVQIVIINKTEGAEEYEWRFEGAVPSRSVERNPGVILFEAKGTYTIELIASNQDGSRDSKSIELVIDDPVLIDFEVTNLVDTFAPAVYTIDNKSKGATSYQWNFEGGIPETSSEKQPGTIIFSDPGDHKISLEISNGRETYKLDKTITVAPALIADFEYEVAFKDDDYETPVEVTLINTSVSALTYEWAFEGATPATSFEEHPVVTFNKVGVNEISLIVSNGKASQRITKTIEVFPNNNLRSYTDVQLGINTAHNTNTKGAFFSSATREVYASDELTPALESKIDLVFFGLGRSFDRNRFVTPDDMSGTTFTAMPNANPTIFINSQEFCNCNASLAPSQFDAMTNDGALNAMTIEETSGGLQAFDNSLVPRVVLFKTSAGKRGAIKIKEYVDNGQDSYILVDIKMQK